ncbi:neutral ceramidase-like protein [Phlyctochytrium arcticum]|nr:neutral ceramidase-like protein [Phlyctochytrium arcticum]
MAWKPASSYLHGLILLASLIGALASPFNGRTLQTRQQAPDAGSLLVGLGKAGCYGMSVFVALNDPSLPFIGYADFANKANGIHLRLNARAFIFASSADLNHRVVFVSTETGLPSHFTRKLVIKYLKESLPDNEGKLYNYDNVMLSSTHTHSGPGGNQDYMMYQIHNFGAQQSAREIIARGIAQAIVQAHNTMAPSTLDLSRGLLQNASINRSPQSYANNPADERAQYPSNVDQDMVMVNIRDGEKSRGSVNWFAVHPTSMNGSNFYVSSDNKGYASWKWEELEKLNGNTNYIAAFAQTNAGDVSPNLLGPHCTDTGAPCDGGKGSCGGNITKCVARGPGDGDGMLSTKIIGERQLDKARELAQGTPAMTVTSGPVGFQHAWIDMPNIQVGQDKLCAPAMGFSFSAGTTDWPGTQISWQGDNDPTAGNKPFWTFVRGLLETPSQKLQDCQAPKVILLATGEMNVPYKWQPSTLPIQLFTVTRKLAIIGFPAEITTMAGRRLRNHVHKSLVAANAIDQDAYIVIAGLSNQYGSYVTTREEYAVQRYEGGSTMYGPHTLEGYLQTFGTLASSMGQGSSPVKESPQFPLSQEPTEMNEVNLLTAVVLDTSFSGKFGTVKKQPQSKYGLGSNPTITAEFMCAHPRNGGGSVKIAAQETNTFMAVERLENDKWVTVRSDGSWDTKYLWRRVGLSDSLCTVEWNPSESVAPVAPGKYRLRYFGRHKTVFVTNSHSGTSNEFELTS